MISISDGRIVKDRQHTKYEYRSLRRQAFLFPSTSGLLSFCLRSAAAAHDRTIDELPVLYLLGQDVYRPVSPATLGYRCGYFWKLLSEVLLGVPTPFSCFFD